MQAMVFIVLFVMLIRFVFVILTPNEGFIPNLKYHNIRRISLIYIFDIKYIFKNSFDNDIPPKRHVNLT